MPKGRPDWWFGTALYFEDAPGDGETSRGPTSNWAYDHANDVDAHHTPYVDADADARILIHTTPNAHHTPPSVYVDRGDVGAADRTQATLTMDGNYYDWSLAGIVPVGTLLVLMQVRISDANVGRYISFRENGNTGVYNATYNFIQVANTLNVRDCLVTPDSNRVIEYKVFPAALSGIDIAIRGWWI